MSVCDTRWGYWREKFKPERKLFETEKAFKIWHVNKFSLLYQLQDSLKGAVGSADLKTSKSALLSLSHHNFSNTKPIYTE